MASKTLAEYAIVGSGDAEKDQAVLDKFSADSERIQHGECPNGCGGMMEVDEHNAECPRCHDFTLQAFMHMQEAVGKLVEAVNSLKDQMKDRDRKAEDLMKEVQAVAKDVHSAKVAGKILLWVVGVIWAVFAVVLAAYLEVQFSKRPAPEIHPATVTSPSAKP